MHYVKKLKTKSIVSAIALSALCLLLSAVFIIPSQVQVFLQTPRNLYDVPREELEGAYVTVDLSYIYDSYAYTTEYENDSDLVGTIAAMEYIIDANYDDFCGMLVETDELISKANALLNQSIQYNYYEIDEITANFTVTGIMTEMPSDSRRFYHEYVGYDDMSAEEQAIFLPLYLDVWDNSDTAQAIIFAIMGLGCLVMAIVVLVQAFTGHHQKQILKKASQLSPNAPEQVLEQLDALLEANPKEKVLFNSRIIFASNGNNSRLYALSELVWAYQSTTTQRVYFIPVGKTHALVLATADGKQVQIPMKEPKVKEYLQALHQAHPRCLIGYSDELARIFRKNPASISQIMDAQMNAPQ